MLVQRIKSLADVSSSAAGFLFFNFCVQHKSRGVMNMHISSVDALLAMYLSFTMYFLPQFVNMSPKKERRRCFLT